MSELDQARSSEQNAASLSSDLRAVYGIKGGGSAIGGNLPMSPLPSVFSAKQRQNK